MHKTLASPLRAVAGDREVREQPTVSWHLVAFTETLQLGHQGRKECIALPEPSEEARGGSDGQDLGTGTEPCRRVATTAWEEENSLLLPRKGRQTLLGGFY